MSEQQKNSPIATRRFANDSAISSMSLVFNFPLPEPFDHGAGTDLAVRVEQRGITLQFEDAQDGEPLLNGQIHLSLGDLWSLANNKARDFFTGQSVARESVHEVIADIAFAAGNMVGKNQLVINDSRELMANIETWSNEFESAFDKEKHGDDYMGIVDEYAVHRLLGEHGKAEMLLTKMKA